MRRVSLVLIPLFAVLFLEHPARADGGDAEVNYNPGQAERRSGFALGLTFATMFGSATGYPDDANKINVPAYEGRTGAAGGVGGGFWLGAALRDWFVFGVGTTFVTVAGGNASVSRGSDFILHLEGFPLFPVGGALRDLGLVTEFGTGSRDIHSASTETASSGTTSYLSFGLLWEPVRVGKHISLGPIAQVSHEFSDRFWATFGVVGVQVAYYGGPD